MFNTNLSRAVGCTHFYSNITFSGRRETEKISSGLGGNWFRGNFFLLLPQNQLNMNIQEFIKNIEDEFDDLKPGMLKADSKFREVFEWNSINALILIAMVKTEYDVTLNADDLIKSKTVNDIYSLIENRKS